MKNAKTEYAEAFQKLPKGELKQTFNDFNDVKISSLGENVKLHYTPNTKNDIFTLTLRYGVGEHEMPLLPYAAMLMENAGIMGNPALEGKDFDQQIAQLGAAVSYGCNDSYFYISISGEDENMNKIMFSSRASEHPFLVGQFHLKTRSMVVRPACSLRRSISMSSRSAM